MKQVSRREGTEGRAAAPSPARRAGSGARTDSLDAGEAASGDLPLGWLGGDGGESVPEHLQERFAAAGADISDVRLHTGAASAEGAADVSARAFAFGQDVHFGAGEYQPGTADGDRLIAHELAHTVQQRGAPAATPQFALDISQAHDAAEVEADQFADAIVSGSPRAAALPILRPGTIARQTVPAQQHAQPPAAQPGQQEQQPAAAGAASFTDAAFAAGFGESMNHFRRVAAGRSISALFTPDEQRAVAQFLTDHHLPPVGTFATFFTTADESLRFVFSASLHVHDRSRSMRGANGETVNRAVRANDCGDWVGRVVTYARNEAYVSRVERHRNHLASPDGLFRNGRGNQLLAEPGANGIRSHAAVDRSIVERLLPGDWVMIHWHAGTRAGEDNHSMMFIEWQGPWRADGYRRATFANQGNNEIGGGSYCTVPVCADASKPRYIYNVRSSRAFSEAGHPGAGAAPAAPAHAAAPPAQAAPAHAAEPAPAHAAEPAPAHAAEPEAQAEPAAQAAPAEAAAPAAPEVPAVLAPIIAAHPEKVRDAAGDDQAPAAP